ncbi:hypothetical protein JB92DRAFT_2965454 [Gautieria morchelliformis]|nr:hypothetical protein JB92DRAFT_2965454 [Gautieria morchelliformis]
MAGLMPVSLFPVCATHSIALCKFIGPCGSIHFSVIGAKCDFWLHKPRAIRRTTGIGPCRRLPTVNRHLPRLTIPHLTVLKHLPRPMVLPLFLSPGAHGSANGYDQAPARLPDAWRKYS